MSGIRNLDSVLNYLQFHIKERLHIVQQSAEVSRSGLGPAETDEIQQRLTRQETEIRDLCIRELERLVHFPPRHARHQAQLDAFWAEGNYEQSVFIMTKFPGSGGAPKDAELNRVIAAVREAVLQAGFVPRIASAKKYHPLLWDNVELYLLACRQGIAIVEDRYLPELNPNVAMEWGWMRSAAKQVLYLVEEKFDNSRADLEGLLREEFAWADPEPKISAAVTEFLR